MSLQHDNLPEPDVLQLNMDTISRELNDLIVAGDKELGQRPQLQQRKVTNPAKNTLMPVNKTNVRQYMMHYKKSDQFVSTSAGIQNMTPNLKHMATYQQPILGGGAAANNTFNNFVPYTYACPPPSYVAGSKNVKSCYSTGPSYAPASSYGSSPKYEFHYLRPQAETIKGGTVPFNSTPDKNDFGNRSTMGAYRKYQKPVYKHHNTKTLTEGLDYDKIVVDLSVLGWSQDGKEINPVLRLFAVLRDLYNAIDEVPPSFEPQYDCEYEPTFTPLPKCNMPCTMNVQYQVKQAYRKATIFLCDMQRLLNDNKMYDHNLYAESERFLNNLRQLLHQFEMYKRVELEHKRGQFISEDIKVQAECLEHLLEHINRQIREVHIRIIALDWFIDIKYRGKVSESSRPVTMAGKPIKRSKIGIINEILQLCNTTTTITPTKMPTTTAITKTATEINNKELLVEMIAKTPINKNYDNLSAFTTGQTSAEATTCVQTTTAAGAIFNTRQPVFYIG